MPNLEYDVPMRFETPGGTVELNVADPDTGRIYICRFDSYQIVPTLRVTQDNISQADGSVLHPRWKTGLVATFKVSYYLRVSGTDAGVESEPACAQDLREMHEALIGALNSIRRFEGATQRYFWQPTGYGDERMLDDIQLLSWPDPSYDLQGVEASVSFSVESPFPYAIDATEVDTDIADAATETITNIGDSDESPVIKVFGPSSGFTITNLDDLDETGTPLAVVYDGSRPGAVNIASGHYAEIDFFRGTIFNDGDGADLIAGIDPTLTDFFHLKPVGVAPTGNRITITGASCTVLSNNAWS